MEKTIAVIATNGFEESELIEPIKALAREGINFDIISSEPGVIRGWKGEDWSGEVEVSKTFNEVSSEEYDGLFIPGGTLNCDKLRTDNEAVELVRNFFEQSKPVAAICHGPQMLIEADVTEGRELTSYKAIKTDLENAGAYWVDKEVVVDHGLVTSRSPNDLPAFIGKMLEEFREGPHVGQHA